MNTKFIMIIVIIAAMFTTGCGDDKSNSEGSQTSNSVKGTSQEMAFPKVPTNDIIAADDFSNLQLNDITKPIYDNHTIWERQEAGLPMALPEIKNYTGGGKVAYLTFDDGPDDKNTPMILDILKNYGIHATFYVCGNMVESYPQVLKRIYEEGHAIGNHSYNHVYKELYPSTDNFLKQISDTDEIIKSVIGVRPLIIRTPGGRSGMWTPDYEPLMTACGYVEHDWNVSVEDATAKKPTPQEMIHFVDEQTNRPLKDEMALILMHSNKGKENTAAALPGIIKVLVDKGYSFGVVTPMTPQPW
ncbi:MAG: polysaccharide deacetylase [Selenomonadaceae bacterium]|nr:polysaccharide deacetylase [Selenomonadaceae bacterium]